LKDFDLTDLQMWDRKSDVLVWHADYRCGSFIARKDRGRESGPKTSVGLRVGAGQALKQRACDTIEYKRFSGGLKATYRLSRSPDD